MKYAIYTRCSTEEQNNGFSHEYQVHGLQSHSKLRDGECIGIYSDTISGTTFIRKELDNLIKYCTKHRGEIKFVFIYRWDRFGRDLGESFQVMKTLKNLGVEINCPDSWVNFQDANWPLLQGINMGMAQSESLKISDRTKDGLYQSNIAGLYTSKLFGYERKDQVIFGKSKKILFPDDQIAPKIKKLFKNTSEGISVIESIKSIALPLTRSGYYRILKNILYAGYIHIPAYKQYPAKTVKAIHEPIISLSLFEKVQSILNEKREHYHTKENEQNIFYAKTSMKCFITDNPVTSYWSKGKKNKYPYYGTPGVKGSILNANNVHNSITDVISTLKALNIPAELIEASKALCMQEVMDNKKSLSTIKRELTILTSRAKTCENDYIQGSITADQFSKLSISIDSQISDLNMKVTEMENSITNAEADFNNFFEHLTDLSKLFQICDTQGKEKLLKAFFPSGITIDKNFEFRTPEINEIIGLFYSESGIYNFVEEKKKDSFDESPAEGG